MFGEVFGDAESGFVGLGDFIFIFEKRAPAEYFLIGIYFSDAEVSASDRVDS